MLGFVEDVAFARHFVATPRPHPIRVVLVLAMPVKKLSKMAGNLTIGIYSIASL